MELCPVNSHLPLDPLMTVCFRHFYPFYIQTGVRAIIDQDLSSSMPMTVIVSPLQGVEQDHDPVLDEFANFLDCRH